MTYTQVPLREAPLVVLIADDPARSKHLCPALQAEGWRAQAITSAEISILTHTLPALVLLDCAGGIACGELGRNIRELVDNALPILALADPAGEQTEVKAATIDVKVAANLSDEALVEVLESWRPVSLAPTRRIATMLGDGPIAGMLERLGRRLEAALVDLDVGAIDRSEAHRLAGLCGTLGFGQAHAAWLDLSLGSTTCLPDVRRTTRLTLAAIAHGL